jgi:L-threonylcarbamoyladenylate synthase
VSAPRIVRVDPAADPAAIALALADAAAALARGAVVATPTETFYGLAVDPARADAVAAIFGAKGRATSEALPLIAADLDAARRVAAAWWPAADRLATAFWPGPLTLVVPVRPGAVVPGVTAGGSTVGVRVSGHAVARALAASTPSGLITATSANRSGTPALASAADVATALGTAVAVVVDAGPSPGGQASTIVALDADGPPRLIREGPIAFARVLESLR